MTRIPLSQGLFALVDKVDEHLVVRFKWYASKHGITFYAKRNIKINGRRTVIRMHRILLGLGKGEIVDHQNGNGLDNRRFNLRVCTQRENTKNKHVRRGVSKYKGVGWRKDRGKYDARIVVNYKIIFLGYFIGEIDAAKAYNEAALKYFKQFANLNVIP